MKKLFLMAAAAAFSSLAFGQSTAVSVTGFTQDVICEYPGSPVASGSKTVVDSETTVGVDDANYVLFQNNFAQGYSGVGLPDSGAITSMVDGSQFQLASYTANNILLLDEVGGTANLPNTGTLALTTPSAFTSMAFLVDGFDGNHDVSYTLHYADGNSQTGSFSALDNFDNSDSSVAAWSGGRVSRNDGLFNIDYVDPVMFQVDVTPTDTTSAVTSIDFANASTDNGSAYETIGVWAVSGVVNQSVPEPASIIPLALGAIGLFAWRKRK